jgi:hypothetical protein
MCNPNYNVSENLNPPVGSVYHTKLESKILQSYKVANKTVQSIHLFLFFTFQEV